MADTVIFLVITGLSMLTGASFGALMMLRRRSE